MTNVLVICDDVWHPGEVIMRGLKGVGEGEIAFDFVMDAKDILTPEMLKNYDVIMNCKTDNLTGANTAPWLEDGVTEVGVEELEQYVCGGGGFLSVHAGNTYGEKTCPKYAEFIGNSFVKHPPRCEVELRVVKHHPVAEGVENFKIRDEHYEIDHIAPDADIFLESVSESGGRQIAGYTREMGEGRICVLTPGHILAVWENESFRRLLVQAIAWCKKER